MAPHLGAPTVCAALLPISLQRSRATKGRTSPDYGDAVSGAVPAGSQKPKERSAPYSRHQAQRRSHQSTAASWLSPCARLAAPTDRIRCRRVLQQCEAKGSKWWSHGIHHTFPGTPFCSVVGIVRRGRNYCMKPLDQVAGASSHTPFWCSQDRKRCKFNSKQTGFCSFF